MLKSSPALAAEKSLVDLQVGAFLPLPREPLGNPSASGPSHVGPKLRVVKQLVDQARETDQASAALIKDLKQRGMLDDTLVIWGGEFGRTCYSQGKLTRDNYGRDHHPRCFSIWMAGGGVKPGLTYGRTDDYCYNIVDSDGKVLRPDKSQFTPGAVHVHDLQATILHLLGIDHEQLMYLYQGRRFRLTDVHGHVVPDVLV